MRMSLLRSATTARPDVWPSGEAAEASRTVPKEGEKTSQVPASVLCHRSRTKIPKSEAAASSAGGSGKRWRAPTGFMGGGASAGGDCGRRTNHVRRAASAMGVPAYEVLQSITRRNQKGGRGRGGRGGGAVTRRSDHV